MTIQISGLADILNPLSSHSVESRRGAVTVNDGAVSTSLSSNRTCGFRRVAQPLLAFAPTEPTVRRYRSGLFRKDLRRIDHLCQAWWITGSGSGKAVRSLL